MSVVAPQAKLEELGKEKMPCCNCGVCVCVCVCVRARARARAATAVYVSMCLCVCVCVLQLRCAPTRITHTFYVPSYKWMRYLASPKYPCALSLLEYP